MAKYRVTAKQTISYSFEVEAENLHDASDIIKNKTIDHDTVPEGKISRPLTTRWGMPEYLNIYKKV